MEYRRVDDLPPAATAAGEGENEDEEEEEDGGRIPPKKEGTCAGTSGKASHSSSPVSSKGWCLSSW
jgi:hypothetical protein